MNENSCRSRAHKKEETRTPDTLVQRMAELHLLRLANPSHFISGEHSWVYVFFVFPSRTNCRFGDGNFVHTTVRPCAPGFVLVNRPCV